MSSRLDRITNWHELAGQANWSPAGVAKLARVSLRTLERHFRRVIGETPYDWLVEQRMAEACELLTGGLSVKEASFKLGYKNQHCFAREFKKHCGCCPSVHGATAKAQP
jgi:AraC-like DNA-binding protein